MNRNKLLAITLSVALTVAPPALRADDIDLYTGGEQSTGAPSNVLIVLDNSSNWSSAAQHWPDGTQGAAELQTLSEIAATLSDNISLGLMTFAQSGSNMGGQVRFHIREMNDTNRGRFQQIMDYMASNAVSGSDPDEVSSSTNYDDLMNAAFRYFNGKARWKDVNASGDRRDFTDNTATAVYDPSPNPSGYTWGYSSSGAANYNMPAQANAGCAKNFIIFVGNGFPSNVGTAQELTDAAALIGKTADTSQVTTISPKNPYADEWARFMYAYGVPTDIDDPRNAGQKLNNKIATYTIDVCKDACSSSQETLLRSMARVGGGKYFKSTSKSEIKSALAQIFAEIQAVNSVFASATLPISVNTQGTYENQVYIGVFRPDGQARPRWYGNLKEYRFARYCDANDNDLVDDVGGPSDERIDRESGNTGTVPECSGDTLKLFLADRYNSPAIDQSYLTGFIDLSATSFWTSSSSYWTFMPTAAGSVSDAPDGPSVERGAAAQRLRTLWASTATSPHPDGRKIFTCLGTCLGAAAGATERGFASNPFTTSNSEVTSALTAPSGSVSVTALTRSVNTATATTALAHGFSAGQNVVISGVTPSTYNGTVSIVDVPSTTSFTYAVSETPSLADTGTATLATGSVAVSSITLSTGTPGATATATLTAASSVTGTSATVAGTGLSYLDGTRARSNASPGATYTFSTTLPAAPGNATGITAVGGGARQADMTAAYDSATNRFTISYTSNLPSGLKNAPVGTSVTISGSSDANYNGIWTVVSSGTRTLTFNYTTYAGCSPCSGTTIAPVGATSDTIAIARTAGSTTAVVTATGAGNPLIPFLANGSTVAISGAADSAYNGNWTVANLDGSAKTFEIGPLTLAPSTPASGTITATLSGTTAGPTTNNLIGWMRGKDLWEDENQNSSLTDVRASIHGDVLHSRPVLIDYGGSIGIIGFYGSNDGYLRSVKGGIADTDGYEKWAFIPSEFVNYTRLSRLYNNSELIRFPNSSCTLTPTPTARNYFWDGQLTVYQSTATVKYPDAVSGPYSRPEKTYLYAGMRRGGRTYYAFDISDPDNPSMLWRIDNTLANFSQLGYTWSEPKVAKLKGKKADGTDDLRDVLIFGAGYDPTDDDQPSGCPRGDHSAALSTSSVSSGVTCPNAAGSYTGIGRGVFVVDALTGAYINFLAPPSAANKYSFPADVALVDMDGDGYVDRVYAGDSGAQLFRFDFDATKQLAAADAYKAYFLATFGDRTSSASATRDGGTDARKFLFAPEAVPFAYKYASGASTTAMLVLAGTGDREKPLPNRDINNDLNTVGCASLYNHSYFGSKVRDKFFGYIDKIASGTDPATVTASTEYNLFAINSTTTGDTSVTSFNICYGFETTCVSGVTNSIYNGWVMNFKNSVNDDSIRDEEKMVSSPKVVSGMILFGTNTPQAPNPQAGVCSNLGEARAYAVNPFTGMPSFDRDGSGTYSYADYSAKVSGGGLPPTVTTGVVSIGGSFYRFVIGAGGIGLMAASPIAAAKNVVSVTGTRSRVYWYYPLDDK